MLSMQKGRSSTQKEMEHSRSTYQYKPLDAWTDQIRLLFLQPSQDISSRIQCSLVHKTLSECHDDLVDHYTALSYVWGDASLVTNIAIDESELNVTVSLDLALRHLRDPQRPRYVWADAICIDQKNPEERNHQVGQMAKIYALAEHTVVFLGDSDIGSQVLQDARSKKRYLRDSAGEYPIVSQALQDARRKKSYLRDSAGKHLLTQPWFGRVWVLQELIVSRDPWVQCGLSRLRWGEFCKEFVVKDPKASFQEEMALVSAMQSFRRTYETSSSIPPLEVDVEHFASYLLTLLQSRRGLGVSDPRDMIFAHLGIASGLEINGEEGGIFYMLAPPTPLLSVDYRKSPSQTYQDLTQFMLEALDSYSILSYIDHQHNDSPTSWVPDWTVKPKVAKLLRSVEHRRYQKPDRLGLHFSDFWSRENDVLSCVGNFVGQVKHLETQTLQWPSDFPCNTGPIESQYTIKDICIEVSKLWPDVWGSSQNPERYLSKMKWFTNTLITNMKTVEGIARKDASLGRFGTKWDYDNEMLDVFRSIEDHMMCGDGISISEIHRFCRVLWGTIFYRLAKTTSFKLSSGYKSLIRQLFNPWWNQEDNPFNGRKIGTISIPSKQRSDKIPGLHKCLLPASTREGDVVCHFKQGDVPIVLRKIEDS